MPCLVFLQQRLHETCRLDGELPIIFEFSKGLSYEEIHEEEFMIYQAVSLTEISRSACEDAKVKEAKEKSFYCMYIIWGRLLDALQSPSEIALTMLALCRAMRQRNRSFWLFKKKKKRSNSFQNLGKSLNSVMLNQKRLQIYHRVIIDSLLWTFTKKYNNKYSSLSKQQSTEKNN